MKWTTALVGLGFTVLLSGCELLGDTDDTGPIVDGDWRVAYHPCVGHRTDTLWFDDDETTGWVGCGSTTVGQGLYTTTDGGDTWNAPTTDPANYFEDFRVSSITRADDGLLYLAGTGSNARVVSMDDGGVLEIVLDKTQTWQVGTFRRAADGFAVAESLTGADAAYRTGDAEAWQDGYGWWTSGSSFQMLDLAEYDGEFYGCGSTIAEPPQVFLPPQSPTADFQLDPVQLANGIDEHDGELWSIDVDAGGIVVGGVNQDADVGMVYLSGSDPYDASTWAWLDLGTVFGTEYTTWVRGVCRREDRVVVLGERSQQGEGFVLYSSNGGDTFSNITPDVDGFPPPSLHRCQVFENGSFAVAGADGFFGRWE